MKSVSANQKGQAIIEYILVLLVVVSILLGAMWQFNDAFRKFADSYFGDYLACLLELGELPTLGGTSSGQCNSEYKPFSIADGRSPKSSDSTGADSSGKNGKKGSGGRFVAAQGGGGSATAGAAETSGVFGSNFSGASREGRPASVVIGKAKDDTYTGSTEAISGKVNDSVKASNGTIELVDQSGGVIDPFEERKMKEASVPIAKDLGKDHLKPKKAKVEINRKVASAETKSDDQSFSFGDFIRWLLIAAIVLALVVFLGGQALQISKSGE